jgi:AmmeMemoRadiSam system protein B
VLNELIRILDEKFFLANARFFAAEQRLRETFLQSSVREAALAGLAYPAQPRELAALVEGFLANPAPLDQHVGDAEPLCLMAPHIDYRRGGKCYGVTYPSLAPSSADLFVLMGTSHKYSRYTFHLCAKDFASPLTTFGCDTDFITRIAHRYGVKRAFADEFLHKREHSLELQLPFLSVVKPSVKIAPILVGGFHHMVSEGKLPHEFDEYEAFVGAMLEALAAVEREGRRVCFIASVDMSHVGRYFGDEGSLSAEGMQAVAQRDQEYLAAVRAGDKVALYRHISEDGDARRICGFPTMYTILDLLERRGNPYKCRLISYDQAVDYERDCAVTFAGAVMTACG